MKGSRKFIILFIAIFIVYVVAELNRPRPLNWTVTLNKNDKNPFGGYILYNRLKDVFTSSQVRVANKAIYNVLNNNEVRSSAYIIISPEFKPSKTDLDELRKYVHRGNTAFISATNFDKKFLAAFNTKSATRFTLANSDSVALNFVNPIVRSPVDYTFLNNTINEYFSKIDTTTATILGVNNRQETNFIKMPYGKGVLYLHANPICFSNYFLLFGNNYQYTATVLSYINSASRTVYWDEYYKPGSQVRQTPLYFILNNLYLLWALRLAMAGLVIYVLFAIKRRQRVIPVIEPLRNSSLDFVQTVSNVYFNQRDNTGIANKKIAYFLEFVRQRFYLQTTEMDVAFIEILSRKSGVPNAEIENLVMQIKTIHNSHTVNDEALLLLDKGMDNFYKQV